VFGGIQPKTLLTTPQEWHALVIGFFEALCPWPARAWLSGERLNELLSEYHYYMAGRALGFISLLLILTALIKLIKGVFL